jgi:mRNA interferase MazF
VNRGEIWSLPDGRNILIISLTGLEEAYGAVLAIVLHDSGRYPDTAMSVVIGDPLPCTAVAVNIVQLRVDRFDGAKLLGPVATEAMARVDAALRAVQDL